MVAIAKTLNRCGDMIKLITLNRINHLPAATIGHIHQVLTLAYLRNTAIDMN